MPRTKKTDKPAPDARGYRLHWEGDASEATAYHTMRDVRREIAAQAKATGRTIAEATRIAYITTEANYQAERG